MLPPTSLKGCRNAFVLFPPNSDFPTPILMAWLIGDVTSLQLSTGQSSATALIFILLAGDCNGIWTTHRNPYLMRAKVGMGAFKYLLRRFLIKIYVTITLLLSFTSLKTLHSTRVLVPLKFSFPDSPVWNTSTTASLEHLAIVAVSLILAQWLPSSTIIEY